MSRLILILYILATSFGLVILKYGTKTGLPISYASDKLHLNINFYTITGLFLYGLSFILYVYLISKNDLGYIIPVAAAFVYILVFVASYFVFKESFTALKIVGIGLIIGGLIAINLSH